MAKTNNMGGLYRILEWIMWIAYINLLWVVSSLVGLLVLGFFPATVAMFAVLRDLLRQETEVSITRTFLTTYKQEFFKANAIGLILAVVGYILFLDLQFLGNVGGALFYVMRVGLILVGFIYIITLLYIFPVYVHFDLKFSQYFKHSIFIGAFSPFITIAMVLGLIVLYYLLRFIPGLIPLIAASTGGLVTMACALFAFRRLEKRQRKLTESTESD